MKNKRGITIISLIVTIVVLLILVGVSVSTFRPNSGIIKRARMAKTGAINKELKEYLSLIRDNILAGGTIGGNAVLDKIKAQVDAENATKDEIKKIIIQGSSFDDVAGEYIFQIKYDDKIYTITIDAN